MQNLIVKASVMFGVPIKTILSSSRVCEVAEARFAIAYAAAQQGFRQQTIARALGRDHSTIGNAVRKAGERAKADPAYAQRLAELVGR